MIRLANKFDIEDIIRLLKEFAISSENSLTLNPLKWSKNYIEEVLSAIIAGKGFCIIDDKKTGILIAVKAQCFWIESEYQLQEVMLHSTNKFLTLRLIKEYARIAREMIAKNEVSQAVFSSYKDDRFERLNMKKLEIHWEVK